MKNTMNRTMLVLAAVAGMASTVLAQTGGTYQQWRFDSNANPAAPEVSSNVGAGGKAAITPGQFSSGWQQQMAGLGVASGFWDLGRDGSITVTGPGAAGGAAYKFSIQVVQYFDGGIFGETATVSVPGATLLTSGDLQESNGAKIGYWMSEQTLWQVPAGGSAPSIVISGGAGSALVDSVAVAKIVPSESTALVIQRVSTGTNAVQVSWPASTGAVLESSGDLNDPQGWTPVGLTPQVVNNQNVITIEAGAANRFFRVRLP